MKANKELKIDTLVYWIGIGYMGKREVRYGLVNTIWHDGVGVDLLCLVNKDTINGIPIHEISFPTKPKKLPKGWSYDTDLVNRGSEWTDDEKEFIKAHSTVTPENIKLLMDKGYMVRRHDEPYYYGHIDTSIDKGEYVIKYCYDSSTAYKSSTSMFVQWNELYDSYDECIAAIKAIEAENKRISELSDYDYNVEIVDKKLDILKGLGWDDESCEKVRNNLIDMKDFENFEFRISCGALQFKHWKNKRWMSVDV